LEFSPDYLYLYQITDDPEQAVKNHHALLPEFPSSRYVKISVIIRLKHAPTKRPSSDERRFRRHHIGPKIKRIEPLPGGSGDE